jgi:hypothetical protein
MTIDLNDSEMMLSYAQEMAALGYHYVAFNSDHVNNSNTLEFFRNTLDAQEYCLVMTNDAVYFESMPSNWLLNDLNELIKSGIDTSCNEAIELTEFANRERERKKVLDNNLNINIMNQKNLEYLKDQLKYTGFGETFDQDLKEKMMQGEKEFKIIREGVYGTDSLNAALAFKKSDQSDIYFFNSYHVNLQKENSKESLEQTFYINNSGGNITLKEAYNLMEGRSINKELTNKEGELYNCWLKLDFKNTDQSGNFKLNHFHQNYGYDLEASVAKHSIKELDTPKFKEDLLNSLKKGNLQSLTFVVGGVESKMYIEANPQFKTVKVYDENMERINHRESKDEKKSILENQSALKEQKKSIDADSDLSEPENRKNNRKSKSHSI